MPRILHVLAGVSAKSGGPTAALLAMLRMLAGTEAQCSVVVGVADPGDKSVLMEIEAAGANLWSYPRESFSQFGFSRRFSCEFRSMLREHDIVHVHSQWNWPTYWAACVARKERIPVVFRPAGALDRFDVRKHALMKRVLGPLLLRRLFQPPNMFHCTARREVEELVDYGGAAEREVLHLPVPAVPGVDGSARAKARADCGIPLDAPVVLFMSRLNYKKGLELLLPALAAAKRRIPSLHFVLAGTGERELEVLVDRLVADYGMVTWTHRVGFVAGARKSAMLAACDVFALPSQNENFGVSVVEALSAGIPVLVSPEVYLVNEIGPSAAVAVSERSIPAIARELERLIGLTQRERETIAGEARRIWAAHFAPELLRPRYIDFYQRAISRAIRP